MRQFVRLLFVLALMCSMASAGCAGLLFPRVDVKDLPQTDYEITRYTSGTKGVAIILDDPNDDVLLTFGTDKFRTKKEGLKPPQRYLKQFMGSPKAYQLQDKETEQVLGYLLISWELEWLVHYNRGGRKVSICIEDPYAGGGNGGE